MPWAAAAAAGVGALSNIFGGRQQAKSQNSFLRNAAGHFASYNLLHSLGNTNPQLAAALRMGPGQIQQGLAGYDPYSSTQLPFQNPLANLAYAPGAINPTILNQAFNQSNQAGQQNMQRLGAMIGNRGLQGGLADAFAFANMAATQQRNAGINNNFLNLTENLRRQDIGQFQNILGGGMGMALDQASGRAGLLSQQRAPMNMLQGLGMGIGTGLQAFGAFQNLQPQQQQQQPQQLPGLAFTPGFQGIGNVYLPNFRAVGQ